MKKRCIVHIGMHKTGSSSIQETLNNYLEDSNYYYVKLNSPNHSSDIISLFSTTPENNHNYQKRGLNKVDIDNINQKVKTKLIENFKEIQIDNFIISGEGIIHLSEKELRVFKDFLYTYFEEITIVGYIRSPWSYMESTFQQQLKGTLNRFNPLNLYPRYKEKFEKFDFVFGRKNVQLWKFDPKSFIGGDVVLDFCHRLGVHIDSNQIIRINEALSKEATSLLYIYRKHGPGYGVGQNVIRENEKMIGSLAKIGNTKLKFSSTLIKDILNKNKEDLEWMENRIGSSLRETRIENQYDIVSEKDLLEVSQEVLEELKKIIGKVHFPAGLTGDTLNEIAISIDILRKKTLKVANNRDMNECQAKDVLVGNDDYLFLCGGNHNIKIFFTGVVEPTLKSIDNFWSNIKIRKDYCSKKSIVFEHFIFPDKLYALRHKTNLDIHSIFKEHYARKDTQNNKNVLYFEFNKYDAENFFYKTDTHLNLYGNLYLLDKIIKNNENEIDNYSRFIKNNLELKTDYIGDLGLKCTTKRTEMIVTAARNNSIQYYTNGVVAGNNGMIDILLNNNAIYKKRLLIFGDSFFRSTLHNLAYFYKEIIFCRTQFFHPEVVERCSPDIIFTSNAERYLSKVENDEERDNFFVLPLLNDKASSPTNGFGENFRKLFDFTNINRGAIDE